MKKKIKFLIPILFIAARRLTVRSCGYPCKNPSKEQKGFYRKNQRGEDAAKQLRGYKNTLLMEDLGEPNGCLLGMWGDIRRTDSANSPIVYCDPNGVVKHIIIRSKTFRSSVSTNRTLCESRFFGIQINPPYALIPYGGFTVL